MGAGHTRNDEEQQLFLFLHVNALFFLVPPPPLTHTNRPLELESIIAFTRIIKHTKKNTFLVKLGNAFCKTTYLLFTIE